LLVIVSGGSDPGSCSVLVLPQERVGEKWLATVETMAETWLQEQLSVVATQVFPCLFVADISTLWPS
jgi:hypothetical protein